MLAVRQGKKATESQILFRKLSKDATKFLSFSFNVVTSCYRHTLALRQQTEVSECLFKYSKIERRISKRTYSFLPPSLIDKSLVLLHNKAQQAYIRIHSYSDRQCVKARVNKAPT